MLYAHAGDAKNVSNEAGRSDFGELGLGAVVSHPANLQSTVPASGGGGYTVQGTGGQPAGQPGGGAVPVAGSMAYAPVGRTTSPVPAIGKRDSGKAVSRNVYQATGQGSRIAQGKAAVPTALRGQAGSKSKDFPAGGLYGLDGLADLAGSKPFPDEGGLSGFFNDLFKGNIAKAFTPPGGKINRIAPLAPLAKILPTPVRTAIRYAGAAPYTVTVGLFTPASVARRAFGLSPAESRIQEMAAKASRVVAAVVATAGLAKVGYAAYAGGSNAAALGPGTGASGLQIAPSALTGAQGASAASVAPLSAGYSTAAVGGQTLAASSAASAAATSAKIAAAMPASLPGASGSSAWLATAGKAAGFVGKTAVEVTAAGIVAKMLNPTPAGSQTAYESGGTVVDLGGGSLAPQPQSLPFAMGGGGSTGGGSSESPAEMLAGPSLPLVIAVVGIAVAVGVKIMRAK